jgi:DMSO reductase anchor subunit
VLIALGAGLHSIGTSFGLLAAACLVQYAGLVAERWFFFAEAKHPQNLYYAKLG